MMNKALLIVDVCGMVVQCATQTIDMRRSAPSLKDRWMKPIRQHGTEWTGLESNSLILKLNTSGHVNGRCKSFWCF